MRRGVPISSLTILLASLSKNTLKQYDSSLKAWWTFCQDNDYNYAQADVTQIIEFLTIRFEGGAGYSSLNTYRSALSLVLGSKTTSDDCIARFFKGVYRLNPPTPKYNETWDTNIVLNHLSNLYPYNIISLHDLSIKTITLLAIASAQRMQTLSLIKINNIQIQTDCITIKIDELIKTSRQGTFQPLIKLPFIKENPNICPALAIKTYIDKTQIHRANEQNLFISFRKPHKKVGSQTLAHWVKKSLNDSGIDISVFGAHSTRHASTSAAHRAGVSLEVVRKAAGWSDSSNVFLKYYKKDIRISGINDFVTSIFTENP